MDGCVRDKKDRISICSKCSALKQKRQSVNIDSHRQHSCTSMETALKFSKSLVQTGQSVVQCVECDLESNKGTTIGAYRDNPVKKKTAYAG